MTVTGIVVEYNPFHNGHLIHLNESRKQTGAEIVIAVMSGSFLQRGEPALVSKKTRAEMAVRGGADLVVELPYPFAVQHATIFAKGAVAILEALGCDALCFGSEHGDVNAFTSMSSWHTANQAALDEVIKQQLKQGLSYPAATAAAYKLLTADTQLDLSQPNNMLGFQYVQAIHSLSSQMEPATIVRRESGYHDEQLDGSTISSATSIRKALFRDGETTIYGHVPSTTYDALVHYKETYGSFHRWENYWPLLRYQLLVQSTDSLRTLYEMEEGLENRLKQAAQQALSFEQFMQTVKTKRYTWTRLQRVLTHVLTQTTKAEMAEHSQPSFIRLLGMNESGRAYLNKTRKTRTLPLISKAGGAADTLSLDLRASRVYALGLPDRDAAALLEKEEFTSPFYLKG